MTALALLFAQLAWPVAPVSAQDFLRQQPSAESRSGSRSGLEELTEALQAALPPVEVNLPDDPIFQMRDPVAVYVDHDETIVPWPRAEMTQFFAGAMRVPMADRDRFYDFYRFVASGLSWQAVLDAAHQLGWPPPADLQEAVYMAGHNALLERLTRARIQRRPGESDADYGKRNFLPGMMDLLPFLRPPSRYLWSHL